MTATEATRAIGRVCELAVGPGAGRSWHRVRLVAVRGDRARVEWCDLRTGHRRTGGVYRVRLADLRPAGAER